jgi:D-xylose 1-dehydrogenase (NADP+, D-xylono-1,5-lactone-forming)
MNAATHTSSKPVAWGLLSTARINRHIIAGAAESDRVEVVAVASRSQESADRYAQEKGIATAHGSYDALLNDPMVEAVYISLPNGMHVDWTIRALEAGKHVLCEKPFSRHPAEVERAFDVSERTGRVLSEGFMWRHHPQAAAIARLVREGVVGNLRMLRASFSFQLAPVHGPSDARFDPLLDGGSLMDVGCYCLSAMRAVAGEPRRVSGMQHVGPSGVDVAFTGTVEFENDILGHFDCGFVLPLRHEFEVVGEDGSLFVADPFHIKHPGIEIRRMTPTREPVTEMLHMPSVDSYRLQMENVSGAIRGTEPLRLGRADAVGQARAIAALYAAAERSTTVEVAAT